MSQANIQDKIQSGIDETIQVAQSSNRDAAGEQAQETVETVEAAVEAAGAPVREAVAQTVEQTSAQVHSVMDTHKEIFRSAIDETIQVAQSNVHDAGEQAQESVEAVEAAVEAAGASVREAVEQTVEQTSAQAHSMVDMHKDIFEAFQQMSHEWLEKAQSEMRLASEFSVKLSGLRSVPEITAAYREWWKHRLNIMAEDGRRLSENAEKLISTSDRYFGNGADH